MSKVSRSSIILITFGNIAMLVGAIDPLDRFSIVCFPRGKPLVLSAIAVLQTPLDSSPVVLLKDWIC